MLKQKDIRRLTVDKHSDKSHDEITRPPIDSHNTITSDAECEIVALNTFGIMVVLVRLILLEEGQRYSVNAI